LNADANRAAIAHSMSIAAPGSVLSMRRDAHRADTAPRGAAGCDRARGRPSIPGQGIHRSRRISAAIS